MGGIHSVLKAIIKQNYLPKIPTGTSLIKGHFDSLIVGNFVVVIFYGTT